MVADFDNRLGKQEILEKLEELKQYSNCQENFLEALGEFLDNNPLIEDTCERWYNNKWTPLQQKLYSIKNVLSECKKNTRDESVLRLIKRLEYYL